MPEGGWDVRRFDRLGSTNDYLAAEARAGAPAGTVAVAGYQSAGRGRLGRRWEAPAGTCLLASVLLRPLAPPEELYCATAAVGLSVAEACEEVAGVAPRLKWPNDLVVGDDKVAGILAEALPDAPGGAPGTVAVVVGVGVNLTWPGPPGAGGTALADHAPGDPADGALAGRLLAAALDRLGTRLDALDTPPGRRALLDQLRGRCATLGRTVRVELAAGAFTGTALAIDDHGRLVVGGAEDPVVVAAADVVHLRPAGAPGDR